DDLVGHRLQASAVRRQLRQAGAQTRQACKLDIVVMAVLQRGDTRLDRAFRRVKIMVADRKHQDIFTGLLALECGKVDLPTVLAGWHDAGDACRKLGHGARCSWLTMSTHGVAHRAHGCQVIAGGGEKTVSYVIVMRPPCVGNVNSPTKEGRDMTDASSHGVDTRRDHMLRKILLSAVALSLVGGTAA